MGKRIQTVKNTRKIFFYNFEHLSLATLVKKLHKNNWACNCLWHSYYFVQFQYKRLLNLPKKLGKRTQTTKNTKNWTCFITLSTPPCHSWSSDKIKTIWKATKCSTLIISCNFKIGHYLTCPKTSGKGPKRIKILKIEHFL